MSIKNSKANSRTARATSRLEKATQSRGNKRSSVTVEPVPAWGDQSFLAQIPSFLETLYFSGEQGVPNQL